MSNLYHVKLKIGKRTFTDKVYANSSDSIIAFYKQACEAKVMEISNSNPTPKITTQSFLQH